jgi:endonuclease/exonuclease/phosphatase family metal-dependent hydrolase
MMHDDSCPRCTAPGECAETLRIATYNIHKGFSHFNRRMVLHELRDCLCSLSADIVFLQEVLGENRLHSRRIDNYPAFPQHEFLAGQHWLHCSYGKNCVYDAGHHGNAILSRHPILDSHNRDISAHRFESRGLLHSEVLLPGRATVIHCFCVHLGLFARGRRAQLQDMVQHIRRRTPEGAPVIIAGDFNDWRNEAGGILRRGLGLVEVFEQLHGKPAKSFPAPVPVLPLDRIYVRGLEVVEAQVHARHPWDRISDHAALSAVLRLT